MAAVRLVVRGHVQGVGFRFRTAREAQRVGVTGSAVNLPDGTVEVTAHGSHDAVQALIDWVSGPASPGRVDDVDLAWLPGEEPVPGAFTTG